MGFIMGFKEKRKFKRFLMNIVWNKSIHFNNSTIMRAKGHDIYFEYNSCYVSLYVNKAEYKMWFIRRFMNKLIRFKSHNEFKRIYGEYLD